MLDASQSANYESVKMLMELYVTGYQMADKSYDPAFAAELRKASSQSNITHLEDRLTKS